MVRTSIPQKLIRKKRQYLSSHRFRSQWVTSFFSIHAIHSLHILRGKRRKKGEKMAALSAGYLLQPSVFERCTIGCEG